MSIPLDELEVKLNLLGQIRDLSKMTTTSICKDLHSNFGIKCCEQDIHLLMRPSIFTDIDDAIVTYKDLI